MKQLKRSISGVYLLLDDSKKVVYVGQSQDIFKRLPNHRNKTWSYFQYEEIDNVDKRAEMESALIKKYIPVYNKMTTKIVYPFYVNRTPTKVRWGMMRELREKYKDSWDSLSSRQVRHLMYSEYGCLVCHATINKDLHNKNYTVL